MRAEKISLIKFISVLLLAILFAANAGAQDKYVDSLLKWIDSHPKIDSQYIQTLHRVSYRLSEKDVKKSFDYYEKVSALSDSMNFTFGKSLAQINLGILLYSSGNFEASNNAYFRAIDLADSCKAPRLKAVSFDDIGENFKILKDYKKARQYAEAAITINTELQAWRGVAINYELLHECALEENLYDESKDYLLLGMPYAMKSNESYILSQFYTGFGKLHALVNNNDSAIFYFRKALDEARLQNDLRNEHYAYLAQAQYIRNISPDKKIVLLDSALSIAQRTSYLDGVSNAAQLLSSVWDDKKNKDSSLFFYRIYRASADSLFSENNRRNVIIKEAEWMIRRKEIENNDLKELARLQSEEINIKNRLLITTIISFLLLIAIIFFVNRSIQLKKKREEASFKQKMAETQMQALRTHINPHFIFNSFNSIENFLIKNDQRSAGEYFIKLASLINMILDASNKDLIPVSKNKMALELYIQLQQLRYNKKFMYKMNFDRNLTSANHNVPPLLIQPYIEDAITNSIAPSDKKDLELSIKARIDTGHIIYTIKDNGIPRKKTLISLQLDHQGESKTETRVENGSIHILNNQHQLSRDVFVKDLYNEYGKPCGTLIEVKLNIS